MLLRSECMWISCHCFSFRWSESWLCSGLCFYRERAQSHPKKKTFSHIFIQFIDGVVFSKVANSHSLTSRLLSVSLEKHFFGSSSRHGNGPSDDEGAVIKSCTPRGVKNKKRVLQSACKFMERTQNWWHIPWRQHHTASGLLWKTDINC